MMRRLGEKLLLMAAAIGMWTAVVPRVASAQTSGVGCDGSTRFFWRGTDSRIAIWRVDANLNNAISQQYGPYEGWVPVAMTVLCNNYSYVLWKYTDGRISLWKVDPNLVLITSIQYGPFTGWIPESLSPDQTAIGVFRILWRETLGYISIWGVDANLNQVLNKVYGPYFGFDPYAPAARTGNANALVARPADGISSSSDPGAEAMRVTSAGTPMPN